MHRLLFISLFGLLSSASAASAAIDGVVTRRSISTILTTDGIDPTTAKVGNSAAQLPCPGESCAGNYQVSAAINPTDITFGTNATSQGGRAITDARTDIAVKFTNDGSVAVMPVLHSTIIPGGFGIYVADASHLSTNSNLAAQSTETDANFTHFSGIYGDRIAEATFNFSVSTEGRTVASYTGDVYLDYNAADPSHPILGYSLGGDAVSLKNFALATPVGSGLSYGFQWDATDFTSSLGDLLKPGKSRTFIYSTEVTASANANTDLNASLISAFVGFGDPIGKGTGGTAGLIAPDSPVLSGPGPSGSINGLTFSRYSINLPTFDPNTGDVVLNVNPNPLPSLPLGSGVPEPSSWMLMLVGLGGLGGALRRGRMATGPTDPRYGQRRDGA